MRHRIIRRKGARIAWANQTKLPDAELTEAIRFVADEVELDGVVIHFKTAREWGSALGWAYPRIPRIANLDGLKRRDWDYLITIQIHRDATWFTSRNLETLAHEAKHIEQFREGCRVSEVACRAFQRWCVERWNTRTATPA